MEKHRHRFALDRMRANLEVENFEIAEEDMRKLDVLEGFADGNDPDKVPF